MSWFGKKEETPEEYISIPKEKKSIPASEYKERIYQEEKAKQVKAKAEREGREQARAEYPQPRASVERRPALKVNKSSMQGLGNLFGGGVGQPAMGGQFGMDITKIFGTRPPRQSTQRVHKKHHHKKHHRQHHRQRPRQQSQFPYSGMWR